MDGSTAVVAQCSVCGVACKAAGTCAWEQPPPTLPLKICFLSFLLEMHVGNAFKHVENACWKRSLSVLAKKGGMEKSLHGGGGLITEH